MAVSRRLRFEILRRDGHACRYCGAMAPDVKLTVDHVIPTALGGSDEASNLVTACQDCNAGKSSISPDSGIVEDVAADALRWGRAVEQAAHNLLADREMVDEMLQRFVVAWNEWGYEVDVTVEPDPLEPTGDVLIDHWRSVAGWPVPWHSRPVGFAEGVLTIQVERGFLTETRRQLNRKFTRENLASLLGTEVERIEVAEGWPGGLPEPPRATRRRERRHYGVPNGWRQSVERFVSLGLPEEEMHRLIRVAMEKPVPADEKFRFFCGCCWRAITNLQEDARRLLEMEDNPGAP